MSVNGVDPVNSNLTVPRAEDKIVSSESRSKVPEVSIEKASIFL
jgi:hypothetical protein